MNVYQKRVQKALSNLCTLKDLEGLISCANILPFSLLGMVQALSEKYYTGVAGDHLLQESIEHCRPKSVYESLAKKFSQESISQNEEKIELIKQLKKIYVSEPCKAITPKLNELMTYEKQISFLNKFYTEVSEYLTKQGFRSSRTTPSKAGTRAGTPAKGLNLAQGEFSAIPLAKAIDLYAKAGKVKLSDDFEEINLLRELMDSSKNLLSADDSRTEASNFSRSQKASPRRSPRRANDGKKSAGRYAEIVPISSVSFSPNKIGRPKNEGTVEDEIKKDYDNRRARIRAFPTLEEVNGELEEAEQAGDKRRVQAIRSQLIQLEEWKRGFDKALEENDGSFGGVITSIEMFGIYIPEMAQALIFRREWNIWKFDVSVLHRKMNRKVKNIFEDTGDMVGYEELENLVHREEKIKHMEAIDDVFKDLRDKLKTLADIREELKSGGESLPFKRLRQIKQDLKNINVSIPELKLLRKSVTLTLYVLANKVA